MDYKQILDRLDFNEDKIRDALKDLQETKASIEAMRQFNIHKLISSEKYRIQFALEITKNYKEASVLLNISYRMLHRKMILYEIN